MYGKKTHRQDGDITGYIQDDGRLTDKYGDTTGYILTTACVEYKGLSDDCEELTVLREFTDNYMETGYQIDNLKLFNVYTKDDARLVWIVFTASLCSGQFIENSETEEILFFSRNNPPTNEDLRGELTKKLLQDLHLDEAGTLINNIT